MAQIPVTKEALAKKRLKPLTSLKFLTTLPVVEVVIGEFSSVAANFPIFFVERDGAYIAVALLSLIDQQNMFVEEDGTWSGYYLPAAFRRYPFMVAATEVDGKATPALLIDDEMLSDSEGEPLFADEEKDEPNSPVGRAIRLIAETDRNHGVTRALVAELNALGLIQPSSLGVQLAGQQHNVGGLFGIDEKKLNELADEEFLKLRRSGALALAHIQLQSVGQIQRLVVRHNRRDAAKNGQKPAGFLD